MKIAIVHPSLAAKGGAERVVVWLANELARRGHAVTIFTSDYDDTFFGPPHAHRFTLAIRDLGGYSIDPFRILKAGWCLRRELAGFDLINPHNFPSYHWAYLARLFGRTETRICWFCEEPVRWFYPNVCNRHFLQVRRRRQQLTGPMRSRFRHALSTAKARVWNWRLGTARALDRWIVPQLDHILTNSAFIADQIRTIFRRDAAPCLLGIPRERFSGAPTTASSPLPGRYLLTVSRLFPEKNIETVLEAIRILRDSGPLQFDTYVIAGDGPARFDLERYTHQLHIEDIVRFLGFVAEEDLTRLYQNATAVIYLPLDETFGLVFVEAALHGRAVIAPNHGGPAEIVKHGVTGWQVDPTDPQAVAEGIKLCLQHPEWLRTWGEAAYRWASTELTFARFVDRFEECLGLADQVR